MPWSYGPSQQRRENRLWRDLKEENRLLLEHNEKLKDENSVLKAQTDQWEAQAGPIIRQRNELQADLASMTEGFMQQRQLAQQLSCEVGQLAQEKVDWQSRSAFHTQERQLLQGQLAALRGEVAEKQVQIEQSARENKTLTLQQKQMLLQQQQLQNQLVLPQHEIAMLKDRLKGQAWDEEPEPDQAEHDL